MAGPHNNYDVISRNDSNRFSLSFATVCKFAATENRASEEEHLKTIEEKP